MFSAQSFSPNSPPGEVVPLIGADRTLFPSRERKSSGDAEASRIPASGNSITAANGAGFPSARRSPNASIDESLGRGAESRRVRLTWYTSPAAIDSRMLSTLRANSDCESDDDHEDRLGPIHGREARGSELVGRRRSKRAQTGTPSKGMTTAHHPVESRAERSDVRSTRPDATKPPTTTRGSMRWAVRVDGATIR